MSVIIYAFVAGALTSNSGDYINIENVFAAYVEYYQNINSHIIAEFTSDAKFSEVIELARANPDKQYKFIFVARHGASLISAITNIPSNVEIIWTGHHLNEGWRNLRIDTCYSPSHVASPYLSGGQSLPYRIVPLPGVPVFELESNSIANGSNGAADDGLLSSFDTHRKDLIWMLSGDASASLAGADDLASSWLLLTPEYADKVVHALQSNDFFDDVESVSLVNGPRTGKMQKITSTTDLSLFSDPKVQETLYHSKPFDPEELFLRIKKLLDLYESLKNKKIKIAFGEFIFDTSNLKLQKNDKLIYLTEGENNLLIKLINKRNDIVLREELADQEFDETELRKVDVQVTRLRQKIETNAKQPQFIKTIRGKGYKLICNEI